MVEDYQFNVDCQSLPEHKSLCQLYSEFLCCFLQVTISVRNYKSVNEERKFIKQNNQITNRGGQAEICLKTYVLFFEQFSSQVHLLWNSGR